MVFLLTTCGLNTTRATAYGMPGFHALSLAAGIQWNHLRKRPAQNRARQPPVEVAAGISDTPVRRAHAAGQRCECVI